MLTLGLSRVTKRILGTSAQCHLGLSLSSSVDNHAMDSRDEPTGVPNCRLAAVADLCHLSGYSSLFVMYCTVSLN